MNVPTTIDRKTNTLSFFRTFNVPCEEVFEAWTKPDQISEWWDPSGTRLADCKIDLRVGGAFSFTNASGHSPPFAGVYCEVTRPHRLVFEAMGALGTVLLETTGEGTRMTVTIRCSSKEHLEQFIKLGVDVGTDKTFDNLVAFLA
ncbi:MAG: SRPBCC domain-containing protein [Polyangiaceae bacterium]|nr:SRPBCC domain-containing protein [Polyangiaceae bacterium]